MAGPSDDSDANAGAASADQAAPLALDDLATPPAGLQDGADAADSEDGTASDHRKGHRQRLRQRFLQAGPEAFQDYELLELILFAAIPRRDVKPLAKRLVERFGSFADVVSAEPGALAREKGLSEASIVALKAVRAGAERLSRQKVLNQPVLSSWQDVLRYLRTALNHERREEFRVLFLDRRNMLIGDETQQRGTVDHTPAYPREVIKRTLELDATAIILVHNHPSGDAKPSKADIELTKQIKAACQPLGIALHDHIIVGRKATQSFKEINLL